MHRTIISLDPDDRAWLDRKAREEGTTMTEVVRVAIRRLRKAEPLSRHGMESLLDRTRGRWKKGDALDYQRRVRAEW
jgi:hypothetical protein